MIECNADLKIKNWQTSNSSVQNQQIGLFEGEFEACGIEIQFAVSENKVNEVRIESN